MCVCVYICIGVVGSTVGTNVRVPSESSLGPGMRTLDPAGMQTKKLRTGHVKNSEVSTNLGSSSHTTEKTQK